jgi:hypothetical protein
MSPETTWSQLAGGLAEVFADMPGGAMLRLVEKALPDGGYFAQFQPDDTRLHAEISGNAELRPDRQLPAGKARQMQALGWRPPGNARPNSWYVAVDLPASREDYRRLADALVRVLHEVLGLATPADLGYVWRLPGAAAADDLPRLGLDRGVVQHDVERPLASLSPGDAGQPSGRPALRWTTVRRDAAGRPVAAVGAELVAHERAAIVGYLRGAPIAIAAFGCGEDPWDPARPAVVPLSVHTDGEWVWSESEAYFAERYGIPPDPRLVAHIRHRGYRWPEVDDETLMRAAGLVADPPS